MEHNSLAGIASARPVIYAEGLFAPCHLQDRKFIPEEGLNQRDLWSILNGEFFQSGSDLVEDFVLKTKLGKLDLLENNTFELDEYPKRVPYTSTNTRDVSSTDSNKQVRSEKLDKMGIPLVHISPIDDDSSVYLMPDIETREEDRIRKFFERQVSWLMGDDGEDFVVMETFSQFSEALILLEVLKNNSMPSVVSFLARRDEPVAISFSKIEIDLDCLMFCLFQA